MTTPTEQTYIDAKAAADAAYQAMWAAPKNAALRTEFKRLFAIAGNARRAYEAETGKATEPSAFAVSKAMQSYTHTDNSEY